MLPIIPIITKNILLHALAWGVYELTNYTIVAEKKETNTELAFYVKILTKTSKIVGAFSYLGAPDSFVDRAVEDVKDSIVLAEFGNISQGTNKEGLVDLDELLAEQHEQF